MNLKWGQIEGQGAVLLAMLGKVRFRSYLHFCKSAPGVNRARLGAQSRQDGPGDRGRNSRSGGRPRPPLWGRGLGQAGVVSYPCTGIENWWTGVQFCPVEPEIEGNCPLPDGSSKQLGSRADSTVPGQRQVRNRTVVQWHGRVIVDSPTLEIGQLSSGASPEGGRPRGSTRKGAGARTVCGSCG